MIVRGKLDFMFGRNAAFPLMNSLQYRLCYHIYIYIYIYICVCVCVNGRGYDGKNHDETNVRTTRLACHVQ